ncbi:hypothetical protein BDW74DRAFT_155478 [Aspergillus multicolor]|uniref:uncharacterized protein n=1 Tax=Aspergillus multicolor TaxID=41759 RepID=UPI003CCD312C
MRRASFISMLSSSNRNVSALNMEMMLMTTASGIVLSTWPRRTNCIRSCPWRESAAAAIMISLDIDTCLYVR